MRDGVDVRGYVYWTLLDNFAWIFGYRPTFGLVAVDRTTLDRTVKPSAARYGEIAPSNGAALTEPAPQLTRRRLASRSRPRVSRCGHD